MAEQCVKMGRPREHDREAIALAMLEWALLPDSTNLNGFCCSVKPTIPPSKITEWARANDDFRLAYEATKSHLALRRELKLSNGELHVKAYDLNATVYDHFLKQERQAEKRYDADLSKEVAETISPDIKDGQIALMQQLKSMQSNKIVNIPSDI